MLPRDNFEIIGSYFVDVFYNVLYSKARQMMMSSNKQISITDIYLSLAHQYPKHCGEKYNDVIKMVYNYYIRNAGGTITFDDFQRAILRGVIPDEYYKLLSTSDRDRLMRDIIMRLVKGLASHVIQSNVRFVIDERNETVGKERIRVLQLKCVEIFEEARIEYHVKFNSNSAKPAIDQRVREELTVQVTKRVTAEQHLAAANETIRQLNEQIKVLQAKIDALSKPKPAVDPIQSIYTAVKPKQAKQSEQAKQPEQQQEQQDQDDDLLGDIIIDDLTDEQMDELNTRALNRKI